MAVDTVLGKISAAKAQHAHDSRNEEAKISYTSSTTDVVYHTHAQYKHAPTINQILSSSLSLTRTHHTTTYLIRINDPTQDVSVDDS